MKIGMTFAGGQDLAKALNALPDALSFRVQQQALKVAAEPMRSEAAILAPRGPDAPHIAENIVIGIPGKGLADVSDEDAVVAVGPEKKYFYGYFWEYGWIHHAAHPFMRPAFDTKAQTSLTILGSELWTVIKKSTDRIFSQQSRTTGTNRANSSGVGL